MLLTFVLLFGRLGGLAEAHAGPAWCPFCNGERPAGVERAAHEDFLTSAFNPLPNLPILSTQNFSVYITKGAFVPHYFLIVSKAHLERLSDLPTAHVNELESLRAYFAHYYAALCTSFVAFEHGPLPLALAGGGGGGCIDHFHLHLLPYDGPPLLSLVNRAYPTQFALPHRLECLSDLKRANVHARSYLLLQEITGEMNVLAVTGEIPSQLMRQLIASALGQPEEWNWRTHVDRGDYLVNSALTLTGLALYRLHGAAAGELMTCHQLLKSYGSIATQ